MKLNNNDDSHNSGLNLLIYNMLLDIESHPTWVCGLKLVSCLICLAMVLSHPTWVCGLKRHDIYYICFFLAVTPYVGVWIETPTCDCFQNHSQVTRYVGVWIETSSTMLCT